MSIDIKSFVSLVKKYQTNVLKKDKLLAFLKNLPTDILINIISIPIAGHIPSNSTVLK